MVIELCSGGLVWFASVAAAYNRLIILIQVFIFIFIIQSDMSVLISCNNSGALSIVVGILKSREGTSSSHRHRLNVVSVPVVSWVIYREPYPTLSDFKSPH